MESLPKDDPFGKDVDAKNHPEIGEHPHKPPHLRGETLTNAPMFGIFRMWTLDC